MQFFAFNLEKFTPDGIFLYGHRPWCPWPIWGMLFSFTNVSQQLDGCKVEPNSLQGSTCSNTWLACQKSEALKLTCKAGLFLAQTTQTALSCWIEIQPCLRWICSSVWVQMPYLAVQTFVWDSSIPTPVTTEYRQGLLLFDIKEWRQRLVTFETFDQSDEETWPDPKKKTMTKTITMTMTKTNTFREHLKRAILETCDFWDIWQIHLENTLKRS